MRRLWFITNPGSGSATAEKCAAIEAVFDERGLTLAGRTHFPDEALPDGPTLDAADIDTVVLFAGDGTINAALCALGGWGGGFLILPGGTMNLLAKALHDSLDPHAIIHAAHAGGARVGMPFVEAGPHRAFVGLILGPAAAWGKAREQVRRGRVGGVIRAARAAWARTFGTGIRVAGAPGLTGRYQAVFVTPEANGLHVAGIDARDWSRIVELGWTWVTGDWVAARAVDETAADRIAVVDRKPALALFDGEMAPLDPHIPITGGMTPPMFVATKAAAA